MKLIKRTLFLFQDCDERLIDLDRRFFSFSFLLNNLMNEAYVGRKLKFINLYLSTVATYNLHSDIPINTPYYYNGHLKYFGVLDLKYFNALSIENQKKFVWEKGYTYVQSIASVMKNDNLSQASEYAFRKGIESNFDTDIKLIERRLSVNELSFVASVYVSFDSDWMTSKLIIEKNHKVFFKKDIDKAEIGIEFFLEMYRDIKIVDEKLVVRILDDLPYKVSLKEILKSYSIAL